MPQLPVAPVRAKEAGAAHGKTVLVAQWQVPTMPPGAEGSGVDSLQPGGASSRWNSRSSSASSCRSGMPWSSVRPSCAAVNSRRVNSSQRRAGVILTRRWAVVSAPAVGVKHGDSLSVRGVGKAQLQISRYATEVLLHRSWRRHRAEAGCRTVIGPGPSDDPRLLDCAFRMTGAEASLPRFEPRDGDRTRIGLRDR